MRKIVRRLLFWLLPEIEKQGERLRLAEENISNVRTRDVPKIDHAHVRLNAFESELSCQRNGYLSLRLDKTERELRKAIADVTEDVSHLKNFRVDHDRKLQIADRIFKALGRS